MSSDADAHKVGLIPVTLMVSGNIMGSGVFLLPANLAATGGIAIYGWLVTIIGCPGAVDGLCQNVVLRSQSRRFLCLRTPLLRAVFGLSNERAVLAGMLDR